MENIDEEQDRRTITVQGHFGDKEVTKAEFIQQWLSHCNELKNISWEPEWLDEVASMNVKVAAKAGEKFEVAYKEENK